MAVTKHQILAVFAACAVVAASFYFKSARDHYLAAGEQTDQARRELSMTAARGKEIEDQRRLWHRVKRFVDRAKALGLEPGRWDRYEVIVEEPLTFQEAQDILDQAVSGASYLFHPISLEARKEKVEAAVEAKTGKANDASGDSPRKEGDLILSLRGAFLVRER